MFAVIIPYFQRQPGILAKALRSVTEQDMDAPICVYIADDASPAPPELEVAAVEWPAHCTMKILKQPNGGPGAARNLALNNLADESFVAFLDSDDVWLKHHLSAAFYAFRNGFDLYTADWPVDEQDTRAHALYYANALKVRALGEPEWAFALDDDLINYSVCGPIGLLSVMVVKREHVSRIRFEPSLRTAGEDGLFVTQLAAERPRVLISNRIDVQRGRGVNIFSEGGWNSRAAFLRSIYYLQSRLLMRPLVAGFPVAAERLAQRIAVARQGVWEGLLSCIRRREMPPREFFDLTTCDPDLFWRAPHYLARILRKRNR